MAEVAYPSCRAGFVVEDEVGGPVVFAAHEKSVEQGQPAGSRVGQAQRPRPRGPIGHPTAQLETAAGGRNQGEPQSGQLGLRFEDRQNRGRPIGAALCGGPASQPPDQASDPGSAATAEYLAEQKTRRDAGSETEQSPGPHRGAVGVPKAACDRRLHAVNLIPRLRPENRDSAMPDANRSPGRPPIGRLLLLALIVVTGLVLFFALERNTPAVVAPATEDSR